ncbi:hypothetical protein [Lacticaseibacillus paracasei]|uniref:hypothetical protein n=1 Tax=Lacticaseibacillus paracasei TaxID=1597 RepID=UPI0007BECA2F|nr:hypothetical protein [Lacticaseibacillus paracasei]URW92686.1 hypothetical protein NCY29_06820 [Lacticaseibacillus paracasei]
MALRGLPKIKKAIQIDTRVFNDWDLVVVGQRPYFDFEDKEKVKPLGLAVDMVIADDRHDYDGEIGLNLYGRVTVKMPGVENKGQFPLKQRVKVTRLDKATVWGKYFENLSLYGEVMSLEKAKEQAQKQKGAQP